MALVFYGHSEQKATRAMRKKAAVATNRTSGIPTIEARPALAPVFSELSQNGQSPSDEAIRLRAYQKWENAGKPDGDGVDFWLEAERELSQAK